MVKQLVLITTLLLVHNNLEVKHYAYVILDFTMLAQNMLHNIKTLVYMEYALHRLDKIKMVFEKHCSINAQLLWPTFHYLKLHAMSHFV